MIAPSFSPPEFIPARWLRNGHLQTILPALWKPPAYSLRTERIEVPLPDGDRILLHDDRPDAWQTGEPIVVLVHGLTGSHASPYMVRIAAKLRARGLRAIRMDQRGCGAGQALATRASHAGRSGDLGVVIQALGQLCPESPISVLGFSLGGNLVLKFLGEVADDPPPNVVRAAVVAPPIDLATCSQNLRRGLNRVYDQAFVRGLLEQVRVAGFEPRDTGRRTRPRTVYEFDDQYTAPLGGFDGVDDYYTRASSGPLLTAIRVPTLIVAAEDDPLVPVRIFSAARSAAVALHVTRHGGHLGFYGQAGVDVDRYWLDWRMVEFVSQGRESQPDA